jgi:sulfite reductase alpha subunit-like flavoprotein
LIGECRDIFYKVPKREDFVLTFSDFLFRLERHARGAKGPVYVFFGCRSEEQDNLYADELEQFQKEGLLTGWFVGYSRSKKFPTQYVQSRIIEQKDLIWNALQNQNAHLYVCGSGSRVGTGVREALLQIFQEQGWSNEESERYLTKLEDTGRYEQDVWG